MRFSGNDAGPPEHKDEQQAPELGPGLYGVGDGRDRGKRPRTGVFYVHTVTPTIKKGPKWGRNSRKDRRCRHKTEGTENRRGTPHTPGRVGREG